MKVRLISASVALAIIIPLLLIGGIPFAICIGILSVLAYKEILDLKELKRDLPNVVKILGLFSVIYLVIGDYKLNSINIVLNYSKLLIPLVTLLIPTVFYEEDKYSTKDAFYLIGWIFLIGFLFSLIIAFRNINIYLLIYLLSVTIITDTFAYLIGTLIGKHKMCPKISPKKSWEGAIAGTIGGSIISIIIYSNLVDTFSLKLVIVSIILSIVGQIGRNYPPV